MGELIEAKDGRIMRPHPFQTIRTLDGPPALDLVGGPRDRYDVIYADPPWNFENYSELGEDRNAKAWYDCMSIEDLYALPVADLAAPDCALFMWVTDPTLDQGIELMKSWGFDYVTVAFQWVKLNKSVGERRVVDLDKDVFMSTGYYTRANPEMILIGAVGEPAVLDHVYSAEGVDLSEAYTMLLGKRGSPKRISASVRQTVFAPRGMHSEKPLIFRAEIERLMKANRRIELFCRHNATQEWDAWGNQVGAHDAGTIKKRRQVAAPLPLLAAAG